MFNIESVLHELNIPYITKGKNLSHGRYGVSCPYCGDTGYHAAFTPDGEVYTCWKCGWHKSMDALMELSGRSYYEVSTVIRQYEDQTAIIWKRNKASGVEVKMIGGELNKYHRKYLIDRSFDPDELILKYRITGTNPIGLWGNRIIIPIYYQDQLISYQGRDITNQSPERYKFLPLEKSAKDPKTILYNIDNCKKSYVAVVEGAMKVWKFGNDCVASFGVNMREAQYRLLSIYEKVYILFDPDEAGRSGAKKLADKLAGLGTAVEIIDTENKYIDDMSKQEIRELRLALDFDR